MAISSSTSLLEAGRELAPLIREHSGYGDVHGRLAPEVADAFRAANFFGMWVPEELGGAELDPLSALELVERVSYEDAASGWVLFAAAVGTAMPGFYLPDEGAAAIFGDGRRPSMAGQGTRAGRAVAVDGGFKLSGSWNFASGVRHATHIYTLGVVEGTNEPRLFVAPIEDVELLDSSWDVLGLRGTGSLDYNMHDVFVPAEFTYNAFREEPLRGGPGGRLGLVPTAIIGHSGWALGVARRLLDELTASVVKKAGRAGAQAGSDSFHEQYANAEAALRAAKALLRETWRDNWQTLTGGEYLSTRQNTLLRLALNNATWSAFRVGQFVYVASGSEGMRPGPVQRFYRDLHGGTQHIMSGPSVLRHAGRELARLADGQHWVYADLVDPT